MKLTVVRHGQTIENVNRTVQGQHHGSLSEKGKKQIKELSKELKDEKFDIIYSSDLQRCIDTAQAVHKNHPKTELKFTPDLREFKLGIFQGYPAWMFTIAIKFWAKFNLKVPGTESSMDVRNRLIPFINSILKEYPEGHVLLVTHGGPIRIIRASYENKPIVDELAQDIPNCSVWRFDITKPLK